MPAWLFTVNINNSWGALASRRGRGQTGSKGRDQRRKRKRKRRRCATFRPQVRKQRRCCCFLSPLFPPRFSFPLGRADSRAAPSFPGLVGGAGPESDPALQRLSYRWRASCADICVLASTPPQHPSSRPVRAGGGGAEGGWGGGADHQTRAEQRRGGKRRRRNSLHQMIC